MLDHGSQDHCEAVGKIFLMMIKQNTFLKPAIEKITIFNNWSGHMSKFLTLKSQRHKSVQKTLASILIVNSYYKKTVCRNLTISD